MANLAHYLLNRARSNPDAPAVTGDGQTYRFSQLGDRVLRLAGGLRSRLGLVGGDRVLICMENRPEFFELLFASWAAGLCTVPVNSKLHPREVSHIVGDSGVRAVFTTDRLFDELSPELGQLSPAPSITQPPKVATSTSVGPATVASVLPQLCTTPQHATPVVVTAHAMVSPTATRDAFIPAGTAPKL